MSRVAACLAALHDAGALAGIQLVHGGPQGNTALSGPLLGPSAIDARPGTPRPCAMTEEELGNVPVWFAKAAERAVAAGFDLIELHGAHGFLLDSFLMTARNRRTDSYGGTPEHRMRLLLETVRAVRQRIGDTAVLGVRVSPFTKLEEGYPVEDYRLLVTALEAAGVEVLHLSTPAAFDPLFGAARSLGQWTREFTPLPRIVAGGITTAADAERLLAEGHTELVAVGRAQLANPNWAAEACAEK